MFKYNGYVYKVATGNPLLLSRPMRVAKQCGVSRGFSATAERLIRADSKPHSCHRQQ